MNYKKIYDSLIERGRNRNLECYKERHHIIPKCLGGSDDSSNLVDLTPEEHYLAHQLLVKIYEGNYALVKAAAMMIPNRPSNKMYGWLRRKFSEAKTVEQSGINNSQYGTRWKWISNLELRKNRKIPLDTETPDGWVHGLNCWVKAEALEEKKKKKNEKLQQEITLHKEYYEIYRKHGFDTFVKMTGYQYSKANLVQRFSKLLEDFKPQNGKKR